jgi:hypothetical protein
MYSQGVVSCMLYIEVKFKNLLHPSLRMRNIKCKQIKPKVWNIKWNSAMREFTFKTSNTPLKQSFSYDTTKSFTRLYGLQNINICSAHLSVPSVVRAVHSVTTSKSTGGRLSESKSASRRSWYVTKAFTAIMTPGWLHSATNVTQLHNLTWSLIILLCFRHTDVYS